MWPVGSIEYMKYALDMRTRCKGIDIPFTVGIVVADINRQFARENVLDMLEYFNEISGEMIDFYLPGYLESKVYNEMLSCCKFDFKPNQVIIDGEAFDILIFNNKRYFFSRNLFFNFTKQLQRSGISITGQTQLILVPYSHGRLIYHEAIVFDLEDDIRQKRIPSVKLFFDTIFEIASTTTDHRVFAKSIRNNRRNSEVLDYIQDKLKNDTFDFFRSLFLRILSLK